MTIEGQESETNAEATRIIQSMNLEGQQSLMIDTTTRCPYREMTIEEKNVYFILFPEETLIAKYKYGFIPLRVLQVAAHADSLGLYKGIYVWSERVKPTDPILVGKIGDVYHILARWGEALDSWEHLRAKALVVLRQKRISRYNSEITQAHQNLANLDNTLESSLTDRYLYI
jgi:hypothetical protein